MKTWSGFSFQSHFQIKVNIKNYISIPFLKGQVVFLLKSV